MKIRPEIPNAYLTNICHALTQPTCGKFLTIEKWELDTVGSFCDVNKLLELGWGVKREDSYAIRNLTANDDDNSINRDLYTIMQSGDMMHCLHLTFSMKSGMRFCDSGALSCHSNGFVSVLRKIDAANVNYARMKIDDAWPDYPQQVFEKFRNDINSAIVRGPVKGILNNAKYFTATSRQHDHPGLSTEESLVLDFIRLIVADRTTGMASDDLRHLAPFTRAILFDEDPEGLKILSSDSLSRSFVDLMCYATLSDVRTIHTRALLTHFFSNFNQYAEHLNEADWRDVRRAAEHYGQALIASYCDLFQSQIIAEKGINLFEPELFECQE